MRTQTKTSLRKPGSKNSSDTATWDEGHCAYVGRQSRDNGMEWIGTSVLNGRDHLSIKTGLCITGSALTPNQADIRTMQYSDPLGQL